MPNTLNQMATSGLSAVAAQSINGNSATALIAAGTTQATAASLPAANNFIGTAAASSGVILPPGNPGDEIFIYNGGANAVTVYPPVGGALNNLAANTGVSVATTKSVYIIYSGALNAATLLSA